MHIGSTWATARFSSLAYTLPRGRRRPELWSEPSVLLRMRNEKFERKKNDILTCLGLLFLHQLL